MALLKANLHVLCSDGRSRPESGFSYTANGFPDPFTISPQFPHIASRSTLA
jgi:hypothetical protein